MSRSSKRLRRELGQLFCFVSEPTEIPLALEDNQFEIKNGLPDMRRNQKSASFPELCLQGQYR
jgi:hypothetical protein